MYTMELPSQSGLISPSIDPGTDSDSDHGQIRTHTRKSNKPLLEKKRRARINKSLDQLKSLVLEALKKDSARYSKLEKADILEMTVKHLREVQRHQMSVAMSVDPTVVGKFRSGFGECAQEVDRYLSTIDGLSAEVRMRLMQHLSRCSSQAQTMASYPGLPPMYHGIPSGSPPQALPGMTMRCSLPFGGLALSSPESPSLPVSQASMYSPSDCRITGDTFTPKARPCMTMTPKSEPFPDGPGKLDNTENIAPMRSQRPLMEKRNNTNSLNAIGNDLSERNNNGGHAYSPQPKRQKLEAKFWHGNVHHADFKMDARNILAMDIKMEPVWRPW